MRKTLAVLAVAALPLSLIACSDDNNDGNIDNPDLDPGSGTGLPGEDSIGD